MLEVAVGLAWLWGKAEGKHAVDYIAYTVKAKKEDLAAKIGRGPQPDPDPQEPDVAEDVNQLGWWRRTGERIIIGLEWLEVWERSTEADADAGEPPPEGRLGTPVTPPATLVPEGAPPTDARTRAPVVLTAAERAADEARDRLGGLDPGPEPYDPRADRKKPSSTPPPDSLLPTTPPRPTTTRGGTHLVLIEGSGSVSTPANNLMPDGAPGMRATYEQLIGSLAATVSACMANVIDAVNDVERFNVVAGYHQTNAASVASQKVHQETVNDLLVMAAALTRCAQARMTVATADQQAMAIAQIALTNLQNRYETWYQQSRANQMPDPSFFGQ
ncbi:hypothetical protein ACFC1T_08770 [Kitasatospora sp. NPDC056076]|uniref:hypothetical protein n=1 Tax=Kitasatospora sp. NPDC056076 TaxID=3345703 RepID=UPI0035DA22A2